MGYLSTEFVRVVSYRPWISDEQMRTTYNNVLELKLIGQVYNIMTLKFFNSEREIFYNCFDIDMENELNKDLSDLQWDAVPFTNKYEPLIYLKISKMLLEDNYK